MLLEKIVLSILLIICSSLTVHSLICFSCDERYDGNCRNTPKSLEFCQPIITSDNKTLNPTGCSILTSYNDLQHIIKRGCYYGSPFHHHDFLAEGCKEYDFNYTPKHCHICYTDECNLNNSSITNDLHHVSNGIHSAKSSYRTTTRSYRTTTRSGYRTTTRSSYRTTTRNSYRTTTRPTKPSVSINFGANRHSIRSIKCYDCTGTLNSKCWKEPNNVHLKKCPKHFNGDNASGCYTVVTKQTSHLGNITEKVVRGCYYHRLGSCRNNLHSKDKIDRCYDCFSSKCNHKRLPEFSQSCYVCDDKNHRDKNYCRNSLGDNLIQQCPFHQVGSDIKIKALGCGTLLLNSTDDASNRLIRGCYYGEHTKYSSIFKNNPDYTVANWTHCSGKTCNNENVTHSPYAPPKCYVCSTAEQKDCKDKLDKRYLKVCPQLPSNTSILGMIGTNTTYINATGCSTVFYSSSNNQSKSLKNYEISRQCFYGTINETEHNKELGCNIQNKSSKTTEKCLKCWGKGCNNILSRSDSIQCYVCNDKDNKTCTGNDLPSKFKVDCKTYYDVGKNEIFKVKGCFKEALKNPDPVTKIRIRRGCFYEPSVIKCPSGDCKVCHKSLCNSSSVLKSTTTLLVLIFLTTFAKFLAF